jgi:hypothetical protein
MVPAAARLTAASFAEGDTWARKAILNMAGYGKFFSGHKAAQHDAESRERNSVRHDE